MNYSLHPIARPECRMPFVNNPTLFLPEQRYLAAMNICDEGRDSRIFLVNVDTLESESLGVPDAQYGPYGFVQGSDGKIYVGFFYGKIYCFDPATRKFTLKADPFRDQQPGRLTWGGLATTAGKIYMGVYPTGEFTEYDIASGECHIIAPLDGVPFGVYANQFVELPDGRILGILYGAQALIFIYNPVTRSIEARRAIDDIEKQSKQRSLCLLDDQRVIYASDHAVKTFNFETLNWEADFLADPPDKLSWLKCIDGKFYGLGAADGLVYEISRDACRALSTGLHTGNRATGGVHQTGPDQFVCLGDNGLFAQFSPTRGPLETKQVDNRSQTGMNIHTLRKDPLSNRAVGSHFINSQIFQVDLASGISRSSLHKVVTTPGQITCVTFLGDTVYLGVYGGAIVQAYDAREAFDFEKNPRSIGRVGSAQFRPMGLFNDGRLLFMVTRADYGQLGGAISVIDPIDGNWEVFRDFVPTQNPVSVFKHHEFLVGTTEVYGDQGSCLPEATNAVIFVWDIAQRATVQTFVPWDSKSLRALDVSASGVMIGFGAGKVFLYDVSSQTCAVHPWEGGDPSSGLFLDPHRFLAAVPCGPGRSRLILLDVDSLSVEILGEEKSLKFFEVLEAGKFLVSVDGSEVAQFQLDDY